MVVKAQEWLDQNYPREKRIAISEIYINEQLYGELDLNGFAWNLKLLISQYVDDSKIIAKIKRGKKIKTIMMKCAQSWVNNYVSPNTVELLHVDNKYLEGELDLSAFINLKELVCNNNKLTSLNISNCSRLELVSASNNQLTNLILNLNEDNYKQLEHLYINNNNFNQDLTFLSKLVNLKTIYLHNNKFRGSLEPLRNLKKLETLIIRSTNIDSGLEYLCFDNLKEIKYRLTELEIEWGAPSNGCAELKRIIIKKETKKIDSLIEEIKQIDNLKKELKEEQKQKIVDFRTYYPAAKDLLDELIIICVDCRWCRKQKWIIAEKKKQYCKLYLELEQKIGEEKMEEVELMLSDCEKLVDLDIQLETKTNNNQKLIEEHRRTINRITTGNTEQNEMESQSFFSIEYQTNK